MTNTYVIADIHGRHDLLSLALGKIKEHASGEKHTVIFLGDYIDRGPRSNQVIERLIDGPVDKETSKWVFLRGNHEQMMLESIKDEDAAMLWLMNGGYETLKSYSHPTTTPFNPAYLPPKHIEWISKLPTLVRDEHRLFVHGGVQQGIPISQHTPDILMWHRYPKEEPDVGYGDLHVVHGHTPQKDGPLLLRNRTNLDTKAYKTGKLTIGVFGDEMPGGPRHVITVQGALGQDSYEFSKGRT